MTAIEATTVVLSATTAAGTLATAFLARARATAVKREGSQAARAESAEEREAELQGEIRHLVTVRLPAYAQHLISAHHPVSGLLSPRLADTESGKLIEAVFEQFSEAIRTQRRRIDDAAWAAVRGTASHTQSVANRMQDLVDALQRKHDDPERLNGFYGIDELNEQLIRQLQKAAIASGKWPGHVRKDEHLPDVVAGAMSRLYGWERIKISSHLQATNVGIVGRAAEPVAVACAELMANALEHSSDDLSVEVTLLQTDNGTVSIVVDDAGTGMTTEELVRGTRLVSGEASRDLLLTELGDPPAFGFAAIGRLVADYGFRVSIDQLSPYNGVRAVLSVPSQLLVPIDELANPVSAMSPLPAPPPRSPRRPSPVSADPSSGDDLPQRRRKHPQAMATEAPPAAPARTPDPDRAQALWSDFQQGLDNVGNDPEHGPNTASINPDIKDAT
ncbi:sensor histidine kinase [Streptomyces sp. NPDC090493]|uniref:ATP-binding protein n=1 Tax=Streptomyces sp. NPDC090493 TaxID=3365964 RepID=UPI003818798F